MLAVLWAAGDALTPHEVQERLDERLAYTTVATVLVRLADKGLVQRTRRGRAFQYEPLVQQSEHLDGRLRRLLARSPNQAATIRNLIDALSPKEEAELLRLLTNTDDLPPAMR